jgi:hypothetical protein
MGRFDDFSNEILDLTNQKPVISLAIWRVSPGMMVICPRIGISNSKAGGFMGGISPKNTWVWGQYL